MELSPKQRLFIRDAIALFLWIADGADDGPEAASLRQRMEVTKAALSATELELVEGVPNDLLSLIGREPFPEVSGSHAVHMELVGDCRGKRWLDVLRKIRTLPPSMMQEYSRSGVRAEAWVDLGCTSLAHLFYGASLEASKKLIGPCPGGMSPFKTG